MTLGKVLISLSLVAWKSLCNGDNNSNCHGVISFIQEIVTDSFCSRQLDGGMENKPQRVPAFVELHHGGRRDGGGNVTQGRGEAS